MVAVLASVIAVILPTAADPDLWGHIRFGQLMLDGRAMVRTDPYSFTSDQPWINHEWLSEVAMAAAFDAAGPAGLIALKFVVATATLGVAAWMAWAHAPSAVAGHGLVVFVALAGVFPLLATLRPQLFSVALTVCELAVLLGARSQPRMAWLLPPLIALWANLHGGWLVGLGVLGLWAVGRVVDRQSSREEQRALAGATAASVLATLATPEGTDLWRFVWTTVGVSRPDIPEWWSIADLPALWVPWGLTCAVAVWAARRMGRADAAAIAVAVALGLLSARVGRLLPFFTLTVGLAMVPLAFQRMTRPRSRPSLRSHASVVAVAAALGLAVASVRTPPLTCLQPSASLVLDPAAAGFIAANRLSGRLAVWFDWGEYAIWHFGPALRVSMDGRRETVYSAATRSSHAALYAGEEEGRHYLGALAPDYLWFPKALPVSSRLAGWGYRRIFESDASIVWAPSDDGRTYVGPIAAGPACFPGP